MAFIRAAYPFVKSGLVKSASFLLNIPRAFGSKVSKTFRELYIAFDDLSWTASVALGAVIGVIALCVGVFLETLINFWL